MYRPWVDNFEKIQPENPVERTYLPGVRLLRALEHPVPQREDAPGGKRAAYWRKDSGLPPGNEISEIGNGLQPACRKTF